MKKFILLILFAIIFCPATNFGCSCDAPNSFCESITDSNGGLKPNLILRGKFIGGSSGIDIKVNELIFGKTNQTNITFNSIWGCELFLNELEAGEEYIFALVENSGKINPLSCAIFFLKIENEVVKGKIAPGVESIDYNDLGDLQGCGNAFASIDFEKNISIFPNPTVGEVTIKNTGTNTLLENLELTVYDMLGKKITVFAKPEGILPDEFWNFNIQNLSAGVYIFKLSGIYQERHIRIVKQSL